MLTAEPTGGVVWNANRGAITLRVTVRGKEAHVGQIDLGENAFERMLRVAAPLTELSRELLAQDSMLLVGGQARRARTSTSYPARRGSRSTAASTPTRTSTPSSRRLTDLLAEAPRSRCSSARRRRRPIPRTPRRVRWRGSSRRSRAPRPRSRCCPGVLETRWYAQLGIPAFAYGGGRLDVSHGPGEFIDEAAMRRCAAVYALFPAAL